MKALLLFLFAVSTIMDSVTVSSLGEIGFQWFMFSYLFLLLLGGNTRTQSAHGKAQAGEFLQIIMLANTVLGVVHSKHLCYHH